MLHHPGLSYTVFNIQQNIIRHSKKENVNHNSEKNQSIEINLEVTEMMELLNVQTKGPIRRQKAQSHLNRKCFM